MGRVVWPVCIALATACSSDEDPAAPPVASPSVISPGGPTTLPSPPAFATMTVRLKQAGGEPKQTLRYRPALGSEHELAVSMSLELAMTAHGHRMFGHEGATRGKIGLRVDKIESGTITIALDVHELEEPSFDPTKPAFKSLAGLTGSFMITDRGLLVSASPSLEASETRASMYVLDYLTALPAEPVGLGAEWEVDSTTLRNGITMRVIQTHKLVALDAATARTEMTEVQEGARQLVTKLFDDALMTFEVVSFSGSGTGSTRIEFAKPIAVDASSKFGFKTAMIINRPAATQDVDMTTRAVMVHKLD